MDETLELKGNWWLPETPDCEVPGEFHFSPEEGGKLELQGDLHVPQDDLFHPPVFQNAPLILGITSKGREVSLYDCTQIKGNVSFGEYIGAPETGYRAAYAFIGVHLPSPDAVKFNKIAIRFTNLEGWLDQNPFDVEMKGPDYSKEIVVHSNRPNPIDARIGEYTITFAFSSWTHYPEIGELVISHKAWVTISSETGEKPLETFTGIMRRVQDFLTLGVGEPVYPIEVEGYCDVNKQVLKNGQDFYPPIQIKYNLPWSRKPASSIHPSQMIFTLKTIQDRVEYTLNRWFGRAEHLKPVLDITFSLLYQKSVYSEFRFLGLAQAVESYHRCRFGGKYLPDDIFLSDLYPRLLQAIPQELDPGFKQSLKKGKLRYANEYSLRKRLQDLTNHLASFLSFPFLVDKNERKAFVELVCDTRNYLTHYDPALKTKAVASGKDFYLLSLKLRALIDALLMEEIGFEPEQIKTMIIKNGYYSNLLKS